MPYLISINGQAMREASTLAEAERIVNDLVAAFLPLGVTGGQLGDWRNVVIYFGSIDLSVRIRTEANL